jgi:hypothetical protein
MTDDTLRMLHDSAGDFATLDAARASSCSPRSARHALPPSTAAAIQRNILAKQVLNLPG